MSRTTPDLRLGTLSLNDRLHSLDRSGQSPEKAPGTLPVRAVPVQRGRGVVAANGVPAPMPSRQRDKTCARKVRQSSDVGRDAVTRVGSAGSRLRTDTGEPQHTKS